MLLRDWMKGTGKLYVVIGDLKNITESPGGFLFVCLFVYDCSEDYFICILNYN